MQKIIDNIKYIKFALLVIAIAMPFIVFMDVSLAKDFGVIALNLLVLSLVTGPLGKLSTRKLFEFLMLIRGEIGILMASAALAHGVGILSNKMLLGMLSSATLKDMLTNYLALTLGIIAMLFTVPLLITSNKYLKEKMGAWWFRLHKLAYAIFIFGALHSAFIKGGVSVNNFLSILPLFIMYGLILLASKKWGKK